MSRMKKVVADVVYTNGNIYTMDSCMPKATCLAIKGDRLVYVGGNVQAKFFVGSDTKVIDLKGKTVYPGFNESHMHIYDYTKVLLSVDIYCKTKEEILKNVKAKAAAAEPGEWIWGMGWSELFWEDAVYPTKEDLDQVAPNNPVVLERFGGHMSWVNSKAFELQVLMKVLRILRVENI